MDSKNVLAQPVDSVAWRKKGEIKIVKRVEGKVKFFRPEITNSVEVDTKRGLEVSSRSRALRNAFDHCNAMRIRVVAVDGVRKDKFALW